MNKKDGPAEEQANGQTNTHILFINLRLKLNRMLYNTRVLMNTTQLAEGVFVIHNYIS